MLRLLIRLFSPKKRLIAQMMELQELPLSRTAFEEWSSRIIQSAMVDADPESQRFALADMITHLNPTEDFKEDAYFIKRLRKVAQNQVAVTMRQEIREQIKSRLKAEEEASQVQAQPEEIRSAESIPQPDDCRVSGTLSLPKTVS